MSEYAQTCMFRALVLTGIGMLSDDGFVFFVFWLFALGWAGKGLMEYRTRPTDPEAR